MFFQDWMDKGVLSIVHIMDGNGHLFGHEDFCEKHYIICTQDLCVFVESCSCWFGSVD